MQHHTFYGLPFFAPGWAFGHNIPEAPHRRTRGSWSTRDANEVLERASTDDANRRAQDDATQIQNNATFGQ
jgi:hypothetical protein